MAPHRLGSHVLGSGHRAVFCRMRAFWRCRADLLTSSSYPDGVPLLRRGVLEVDYLVPRLPHLLCYCLVCRACHGVAARGVAARGRCGCGSGFSRSARTDPGSGVCYGPIASISASNWCVPGPQLPPRGKCDASQLCWRLLADVCCTVRHLHAGCGQFGAGRMRHLWRVDGCAYSRCLSRRWRLDALPRWHRHAFCGLCVSLVVVHARDHDFGDGRGGCSRDRATCGRISRTAGNRLRSRRACRARLGHRAASARLAEHVGADHVRQLEALGWI
mmetsp:Transcript_20884/g.72014  ORF Transcript_20884/g.72014 Transcript_20884/m.72014 type:complete len:274 (+) Transcript_20884:471-1292(+)